MSSLAQIQCLIFQLRSKFGIAAPLICSLVFADFRLDERPFFAEKLLGEFTVSKADLPAERALSMVC